MREREKGRKNKRMKGRNVGVAERMIIIRDEGIEEEGVWTSLSENEVTELKLLMSNPMFLFHLTSTNSTRFL